MVVRVEYSQGEIFLLPSKCDCSIVLSFRDVTFFMSLKSFSRNLDIKKIFTKKYGLSKNLKKNMNSKNFTKIEITNHIT